MKKSPVFWLKKDLEAMDDSEWESLCDGCARCCLQKLEDVETGMTYFTRVACRLLDLETCRCTDYPNRFEQVPDCTQVAPLTEKKRQWLPSSCAYVRLHQGQSLAQWHPLVSERIDSVHDSGISIKAWAVSEELVDECQYETLLVGFDGSDKPFPL